MRMWKRAIHAIEIIRWWESILSKSSIPECPICLAEACPEGKREVIKTECGHVFCNGCIINHVKNTQGNRGCPMCRCELNMDTILTEYEEQTARIVHTEYGQMSIHRTAPVCRFSDRVIIRFKNSHPNHTIRLSYYWNNELRDAHYQVEPGMTGGGFITYNNARLTISSFMHGDGELIEPWVWYEEFVIDKEDGSRQLINIKFL